ncbi:MULTISPECIES: GNAT family N-acetyltransferase [Streptomyces]|uniref:Lysine N-acyltransferase MbtK n=1 Tax=Streptomyces cinereoruber TaxID=67260 RepID=A0ABX6BKQ3_9ACTN|nr:MULTISPECIES: GNAT family N-acetyltransferase [Streptomyces]AVH95091.1 N-acetyltransferase [Streptomyces sp. WAC00288]MBB4162240.1 RimJ/RimL family protein N-acetyltransferase [Streptomyces cinereoruber]QEV35149.1 N-acetyltransferase [Streptomyces cinereoruber]
MSPTRPPADPPGDDTLDLRVDDLVALLTRGAPPQPPAPDTPAPIPDTPAPDNLAVTPANSATTPGGPATGTFLPGTPATAAGNTSAPVPGTPTGALFRGGHPHRELLDGDLLDSVASWSPAATPVGSFRLVPVRLERDLPLLTRWMNDPAVAAFWELAGPETVTADHLRAQLEGDGRSVPCLGLLDGTPMSYFEIYRADLDPLARHYPARPHDTGLHLLIGGTADRGRGVGTTLLRAVADLVLDHRPRCTRVLAEPDLRNTPSVSAFLGGGFRYAAEVDLPDKRAALMIRDRTLRHVL